MFGFKETRSTAAGMSDLYWLFDLKNNQESLLDGVLHGTRMSPTMQLILSLIGGGIGGYMAGAVLKNILGSAGNVIVGSIGGGVSEKILTSTGVLSGSVVEQVCLLYTSDAAD